jgi:hypothetical protein
MRTVILAAALSGIVAFAAASWVYESRRPELRESVPDFDASQPADLRIAALERAVSEERLARQLLQEEVLVLTAALDALGDVSVAGATGDESSEERRESSAGEGWRDYYRRRLPEDRAERLISAGFSPGRADWILQREEELQMEALEARYEAGRAGSPEDFFRSSFDVGNTLRQDLGDDDYARYLEANGRPSSVPVSSVIDISPAATAGLRPGDSITAYDGQRVFSINDVNVVAMEGKPGENVIIDIERDGVLMQLVVPRGPLGISSGRRSR